MSPTWSWKKIVLAIAKITVSMLILSLLFNQARQENQFAEIASRPKNWHWLSTAFVLVFMAHFVSFVRWRSLVEALEIPFTTFDATRIGLIGVFFGLFAFGLVGGDSLRIYYAARDQKNKVPEVVCSVFLDRAIGMLVMFTFASVGFLFVDLNIENSQNPEQLKTIRYVCTIIALCTAAGWTCVFTFLFTPQLTSFKPVRWLIGLPKVGNLFQQLLDALVLYRKRIDCLIACVGWSAVVNVCFVAAIYLTAVGINAPHPPFEKHFVIAPISTASNAIPLPGGIGGMEFVLSYFYGAISSNDENINFGISVAIAFRFFLLMIAALGALAWFFSRKQIKKVVESEDFQQSE